MRSSRFIQGVYPLQLVPVPTPVQPCADMRILEGPTLPRNQNKIYPCHNHSPTAFDFFRPNKEFNPEADIQLYEFELRCVRTGGWRGEWRWIVLHRHSAKPNVAFDFNQPAAAEPLTYSPSSENSTSQKRRKQGCGQCGSAPSLLALV
jgi:hypothetical protein